MGLFPSHVLFFPSFFFTSGRFSRELSERSERIISCLLFSSLYSNLNTLINFRAGHPRKNTIQFTALRKHFPYQLNWTTDFKSFEKVTRETISSYQLYADQTISCVLINIHLKIFSQDLCFTPFYCYHLLQNSKLFLYCSRTSHISHFRF